MSFFEDASLVLIPSAQKTSKVYSVKPTDGTGDLTFTRTGDTATRVGPNGLIEKVRTNRALYSQDFSNAAWTKGNCAVTGSQTDPNGGTSAFLVTDDATNDLHYFYQFVTPQAGEFTFSFYAKANTLSHCGIRIYDGVSYDSAIFNLSNGTKGSGDGSIESVGNGWYRVSLTKSLSGSFAYFNVFLSNGSTYIYSGSGQSIYVFGAQYESGVMTDYIATTTAAVSVGPVANVPRLDYLNSSCPRLILEGQRTNLITYSESLDNAAWIKNAALVTANDTTSPDGYVNADKLIESSSTNGHFLIQSTTLTAAPYTFSVFAKAGERNWFLFRQHTLGLNASFNLATGTLGTIQSGLTASIEDYGNGWYRCSVTFTGTAAANTLRLYVTTADNNTSSYAGDNTSGLYLFGAQCELGSYQSSYVNTLGAAVTRGADSCSKTGISSLIGQTEGTIFLEFDYTQHTSDLQLVEVTDGGNTNRIFVQADQDNYVRALYRANNATYYDFTDSTTLIQNGTNKVAVAYTNSSFVVYLNGSQLNSNTFASTPFSAALSRLDLGQAFNGVNVEKNGNSQLLLFKTRLTNAQLAELTTI